MKIKAEYIIGGIGLLIVIGIFGTFLIPNREQEEIPKAAITGKIGRDLPRQFRDKLIALKAAELEKDGDAADPQELVGQNHGQGTGAAVNVSEIVKAEGEKEKLTLGIDVSQYQGTIDWKKVAEAGIDFAMIRVGYRSLTNGKIAADANARYNMQEAAKYGIHLGAYFFSTAVSEAEAQEEARWVADYIGGYPITYPVAYNCEGFESGTSRQHNMTKTERTDTAIAFLKQIETEGYAPMFYASKTEMEQDAKWETSRIENSYKTWVAQYPSAPYPQTAKSSYSGAHHMWQYTNQGTVTGIDKKVDVDLAYFGFDKAAEPKGEKAAEVTGPDAEALMPFTEVNEKVTAKDKTNLRDIPSQGSDSKVKYTLSNGEVATRTGVSSSGWSRIMLDGKTYYAVSSYLTTDLSYKTPVEEDDGINTVFKPVDEKVTPKDAVNLRTLPSVTNEDSKVVAKISHGEVITRTGINTDVGWSRVLYNGKTLYCVSSYLQNAD